MTGHHLIRYARQFVFLIAVSVIILIAVTGGAWQLALRVPQFSRNYLTPYPVRASWDSRIDIVGYTTHGPGWDVTSIRPITDDCNDVDVRRRILIRRYGWPMRCFYVGWEWHCDEIRRVGVGIPIGELDEFTATWMLVHIPLTPIWMGTLVNTMFYVAVIICLRSGARYALARTRIRRGRCPACGYQLYTGSQGCSECGWGK